MKKLLFIALLTLTLFGFTTFIHADDFQLSKENQELLKKINQSLVEDGYQPLYLIVDSKELKISGDEWKEARNKKTNYLKMNTSKKTFDLQLNDGVLVSQKDLKAALFKDLNSGKSINQSLNHFLKEFQKDIQRYKDNDKSLNRLVGTLGILLIVLIFLCFVCLLFM